VSTEFWVTTIVVTATPGTGVLFTLAAALSRGHRAGIVAALGCTLGVVPHMVAAVTGLAAVMNASAVAFSVLKYVGVAYLLYLAWATLRETGSLAVEEDSAGEKGAPRSDLRTIGSAIAVNLLNPKLTIFFFAFLPQFVATDEAHVTTRMLELSAAFMAVTFAIFVVYGLLAATVRDQVVGRPRVMTWMRRAFAGSFVLLGARLATARQ
jgi:threonine/homoserine/homoserine lactone efflux protein